MFFRMIPKNRDENFMPSICSWFSVNWSSSWFL